MPAPLGTPPVGVAAPPEELPPVAVAIPPVEVAPLSEAVVPPLLRQSAEPAHGGDSKLCPQWASNKTALRQAPPRNELMAFSCSTDVVQTTRALSVRSIRGNSCVIRAQFGLSNERNTKRAMFRSRSQSSGNLGVRHAAECGSFPADSVEPLECREPRATVRFLVIDV